MSSEYSKLGDRHYRRAKQTSESLISYYCQKKLLEPDNLQIYHQIIALQPKQVESYLALSAVLDRQGKQEEAMVIQQMADFIQAENFF
ncbi:MAG: hypothetical protein D6756_13610 [Cyanobacteria bacterium J083]|nr:MAG: hypothetical protein D6756_13610 [Cyanobacteria bacterium J083]